MNTDLASRRRAKTPFRRGSDAFEASELPGWRYQAIPLIAIVVALATTAPALAAPAVPDAADQSAARTLGASDGSSPGEAAAPAEAVALGRAPGNAAGPDDAVTRRLHHAQRPSGSGSPSADPASPQPPAPPSGDQLSSPRPVDLGQASRQRDDAGADPAERGPVTEPTEEGTLAGSGRDGGRSKRSSTNADRRLLNSVDGVVRGTPGLNRTVKSALASGVQRVQGVLGRVSTSLGGSSLSGEHPLPRVAVSLPTLPRGAQGSDIRRSAGVAAASPIVEAEAGPVGPASRPVFGGFPAVGSTDARQIARGAPANPTEVAGNPDPAARSTFERSGDSLEILGGPWHESGVPAFSPPSSSTGFAILVALAIGAAFGLYRRLSLDAQPVQPLRLAGSPERPG